jgi:hypothetical protein
LTNFTSDFLGTASAATTDGNTAPSYGLAYDLATGSWANAAQFQQFVRDVLPVTQQKAQAAAKQDQFNSAHWKELQLAQTHDQYGFAVNASPDEARAYSRGNDLTKGLLLGKKAFGIIKNSAESVASAVIGHETSLPDHPYEEYTKNGGLLTEEEFNALGDTTKLWLLNRKATGHTLGNLAEAPGIKQTLGGLGAAYTGLTAGAEMLPTQSIPVLGSWLSMTGNDKLDKRRNPLSGTQWQQAWKEAQGDSLGNAMMNTVLDPYASQETLDRWKRDNPFYQLTSAGAEIAATWYLDPTVIAGKGLGAASRFHRGEFPIREMSNPAIALRQATQRQTITVRNPVTKAYAKTQARRIDNNWGAVEKAATQMSDAEFAQLPMFRQMYRAQDGGAAAYALHWAANNKTLVSDALGPHVDPFDLTRQLTMGDSNAYAMLNKLKAVPPEELQRIAPGAGTLLDTMDALKTKASVLQQETDDLLREADAIDAGTSTSKALPMYHRWEVHTSLADKQKQLGEATNALQKYDGYQNWLDLANKEPILSRVQGPTRARFSEVRNRPGVPEAEQRNTFTDSQFGFAHTLYKMPRSLFIKRANTVEIHSMDSGLMSINRQFDQLDHMFGYAPDGARADTLRSYVRAESADSPEFERYKILHGLEETHLAQAIANRFGIEPDMANTILHKIHEERDKSIQGILSGEGAVYRSAPALADRLTGGSDATLKLVDRNPDAGTINVKLMNGRHVQEFEIPEAAIERRVAPEDVTQTPNYYNPLDTRRLFHQLKNDPHMLDELNAGFLRDKKAAAVHTGEYVGNKFNEMWKPIQLFRLGWPMRVLMDEGARATAIFGPMYWLTGAGADSVRTVAHNIVPNVLDATARKKHGPLGVSMGSGPVTRAAEQAPNQFARAAEVNSAVHLPQDLWDKIVPERAERIQRHVNAGPTPAHPMWSVRGEPNKPTVYDPTTGRVERGGHIVPIKTFEAPSGTPEQMVAWYKDNAELLSRRGMRIVVNPDGTVTAGRLFKQGDYSKINAYAQYVAEAHPETRVWDLKTHRWASVEDAPMSPMSNASFWHESEQMPADVFDTASTPVARGLHTSIPRDVYVTHGENTYRLRNNGRRRQTFDLDREITQAQRSEALTDTGLPLASAKTWHDAYKRLTAEDQATLSDYLERHHGADALTHASGDRQVHVWLHPETTHVRAWNGESSYQSLPDRFGHPASIEKPLNNQRIRAEVAVKDQAQAAAERASGELRSQEVASQNPQFNLGDFDASVDSPLDWLFQGMRDKRSQGAGWKVIASSDGKSVVVPAAFAEHSGQMFRGLTASNGALDVLSEGHGGGSSMFRRKAAGYRVYAPPAMDEKALTNIKSTEYKKAVRYYQVYADTVNDHFGNSPIIQRMIKGLGRPDEAVNDEIAHWLETTNEGQRYLRNVKPKELPTGVWVDDHRYKFNYMVPSKELQRRLGKGRLNPSDFRKKVADEDRPNIYGPDLEVLDRRRGMGRFLSDWADHAWEWLGNKPIDAFSRHPFAQAMYDTKMKNLIGSTDSQFLDMDTIARYQRQAHTFALNEVRRHLYNLTETTNFNDALRFIAPFWGAQYEAISKWLRIISDRPETVGRFFAAQRAVYKNMVVVDPTNDHKEVTAGTRPGGLHGLGLYHPNDQVIMQVPSFIRKKFGLDGIGTVGIPLGSANTVLQGDLPLLPSFGPFMTIPADLLMKQTSQTYGVENDQNLLYRWLFPIGRPRSKDTPNRVLDGLLPGWANRFRQSSGPEDTQARFNMETLIGREMTLRARKLGKPDPTPAEIEKAANHLWNVRIVSGLVMPFQTQLFPDHQYWIDAANTYRKQYGVQWWDKFIDKYGEEAAIFATSSSNSIGVPPTSKGMEEWSKNSDLIQKFPNWTSAIISPQAYMGQFSSDAYGQQFDITLGPGDARALRTGSSLQDRLHTDPDTQLGWREYRKLNAAIEAELHNRGLTNIGDRGAEDLAQIKAAAKNDIATKYPAWQRAFETQATTINSDIAELKKLAPNPIFDNRPDWQGVRQYLNIRQQVTDRLDANYAREGSRSLQAQENGALRNWFYSQVGQLVLDNPSFAEFYSRYLDNDTLTTGSGF